MAPALKELIPRREMTGGAEKPHTPNGLVLEGWAQGFLVGSLVIMAAITIANMRKGVLLHKLILIEVCGYRWVIKVEYSLTISSFF